MNYHCFLDIVQCVYFEAGNIAYRLTYTIYLRRIIMPSSPPQIFKIDSYPQVCMLKLLTLCSFLTIAKRTAHIILMHFLVFKHSMKDHSNFVPVFISTMTQLHIFSLD